jgi:hypothetical protein
MTQECTQFGRICLYEEFTDSTGGTYIKNSGLTATNVGWPKDTYYFQHADMVYTSEQQANDVNMRKPAH